MTTTAILLFAALLVIVWFIYNQKVTLGVASQESKYSNLNVNSYTTVRRL